MAIRPLCVTLATLLLAHSLGSSANMPGAGQSVVEQRIEAMKELKQHMRIIADMVRGRTTFEPDQLRQSANEIAAHAPDISALFPDGSLVAPSNALPAIWIQREKFERLANDLQLKASRLADNAARNNQRGSKQDFRNLGRVCASCHKLFRQKQNNGDDD